MKKLLLCLPTILLVFTYLLYNPEKFQQIENNKIYRLSDKFARSSLSLKSKELVEKNLPWIEKNCTQEVFNHSFNAEINKDYPEHLNSLVINNKFYTVSFNPESKNWRYLAFYSQDFANNIEPVYYYRIYMEINSKKQVTKFERTWLPESIDSITNRKLYSD